MKRIGIISDTHSCRDRRFAQYLTECDEIWHAGDIGDIGLIQDFQTYGPKVRAVRGNADSGEIRRMLKDMEIFEIESINVLLTHIGGYPGKYAPGIKQMLKENKIKLMVCGHSHILKVMYDPQLDLLHVNPGAAGKQGWQTKRTLIRLTLDKNSENKIKNLEVIELG